MSLSEELKIELETNRMCPARARFAYIGAYNMFAPGGRSSAADAAPPAGVRVFRVGPSGRLRLIQEVASANPSYLLLHPRQHTLYVTNEIIDFEKKPHGMLVAYAIDPVTGKLFLRNKVSSLGHVPAQLAVDPLGNHLLVANYGQGNIVALGLNPDGSLGDLQAIFQKEGGVSHLHAVLFDPSGRYLASADLGTGEIAIFSLGPGGLTQVCSTHLPPGSGPRQLAFHPHGRLLVVINEVAGSLTSFRFDSATGTLGPAIQTISTLPADFPPDGQRSAAAVLIHPSGKFLYASNRKVADHPMADSLVAYRIEPLTGKLIRLGFTTRGIACPRTISFDLAGRSLYVLNQKGDSLLRFAIDQETGELSPTRGLTRLKVPVSLVFKQ